MPKNAASKSSRGRMFALEFRKEFHLTAASELFCSICGIMVECERRSTVIKHRKSAKHQCGLSSSSISRQTLLNLEPLNDREQFVQKLVTAFLSADIPLEKVNNDCMKSLFDDMGYKLPSESLCRSRVTSIADKDLLRIKELLLGKQVFLVIDESEFYGKKYINVLVGNVKDPVKTYLIVCKTCDTSVNQAYIAQTVDDTLRFLNTRREDFLLLLSDAAKYMLSAGKTLKKLYSLLSHVTCVAHLLHNCAEKIRASFPKVDNLIARVKASVLKNKERKEMFRDIGYPPEPVPTRWATWLKAALYYADNLPKVTEIVKSYPNAGLLVSQAKEAVCEQGLIHDLVALKRDYSCLVVLLDQIQSESFTILQAHTYLTNLLFQQDCCGISSYLQKRLKANSDLVAIATLSMQVLSPSFLVDLQSCQATSLSVERSFSMLHKLLSKDRHFKSENIVKYLAMHYNTVTL